MLQGQVVTLQLHKPDDDHHGDDDDDFRGSHNNSSQIGRYEFSFRHGVLTKVKAPRLELKATAVDIHGNVGMASAFPTFPPRRHDDDDHDDDDDDDDDYGRDRDRDHDN